MARPIQFTRDDTLHAALGVIPAFALVSAGHLKPGIAFAIGLLPTSLLGIAPSRRLRVVYAILGCLFGVGVYVGSLIISLPNIVLAALLFVPIAVVAAVVSTRRPAGGVLLSLLIPSVAVGTGYDTGEGRSLAIAFILGSLWSGLVSLGWSETEPDPDVPARMRALQPAQPARYGLLLGAAAATAILVGHLVDPDHAGWVATAAMLVMRPIQDMVGMRGVGRALSTIAGTVLVVVTIHLDLGFFATAAVVSAVAIITIGARSSSWYVTSFGTAFLILTIEMYGVKHASLVREIAGYRIVDNVLGAGIALLYGLVVARLLVRWPESAPRPAADGPSGQADASR
jgi:hypothetical protein